LGPFDVPINVLELLLLRRPLLGAGQWQRPAIGSSSVPDWASEGGKKWKKE